MTNVTQIRFAPAVTAMRDYLEPHLPWLEKAVGCKYSETVTFGIDLPIILGRWSPSSLTTKARCRSLNTSSDGADRAASSKKPERNSLFMQLEGKHSIKSSRTFQDRRIEHRGIVCPWRPLSGRLGCQHHRGNLGSAGGCSLSPVLRRTSLRRLC
jgi:hypothetical protein